MERLHGKDISLYIGELQSLKNTWRCQDIGQLLDVKE